VRMSCAVSLNSKVTGVLRSRISTHVAAASPITAGLPFSLQMEWDGRRIRHQDRRCAVRG
jgi:hypothetical protein